MGYSWQVYVAESEVPYGANFDSTKRQYEQTAFGWPVRSVTLTPYRQKQWDTYVQATERDKSKFFLIFLQVLTLFLVWNLIDTDLVPSVSEEAVEHTLLQHLLDPQATLKGKLAECETKMTTKGPSEMLRTHFVPEWPKIVFLWTF